MLDLALTLLHSFPACLREYFTGVSWPVCPVNHPQHDRFKSTPPDAESFVH